MLTSINHRFFSLLAACVLLTVLVFAAQPAPVTARALPAGEQQVVGDGFSVYLPLISNISANTISGRVTLAGSAAPGYVLYLNHYNGTNWDFVQETTTDANGRYKFVNVPPTNKIYVVSYKLLALSWATQKDCLACTAH